jgi:LL-diaminopimelate aminotransferase
MPIYSKKLKEIPTYPFAKVGKLSREVEKRDGVKVINVRIGIPDREAPQKLKELMINFIGEKNSTYGYPSDVKPVMGIPEFIDAVIQHYKERHNVDLKPGNIMITNWTKEVLHHLPRLYEPGVAVIPEPIYPAYEAATILSGHKIRRIQTSEDNDWCPNLEFSKEDRFFYFCDPNNPTGSVDEEKHYKEIFGEMNKNNVSGIFDKAYKDYTFDKEVRPVSITEIPEMMERGFEVVSFSKHTNCVGLGIGFIISSEENIRRWKKLSSYFSQGVPIFKQKVAIEALTNPEIKKEMNDYFQELKERKNLLVNGLNKLGFKCKFSKATPYVFPRIPAAFEDDEYFALKILLDKAHVAGMPGSYFGESGKGYMRLTVFLPQIKIKEALNRIREIKEW